MTETEHIYRETLDDRQRLVIPYEIFGPQFVRVESVIFDFAARLSADYTGGYWTFFLLEPGKALMMMIAGDELYSVNSPNGYHGVMSGEALGIVACLYCYSHLSFGGPSTLAQECARQFHTLRARRWPPTRAFRRSGRASNLWAAGPTRAMRGRDVCSGAYDAILTSTKRAVIRADGLALRRQMKDALSNGAHERFCHSRSFRATRLRRAADA